MRYFVVAGIVTAVALISGEGNWLGVALAFLAVVELVFGRIDRLGGFSDDEPPKEPPAAQINVVKGDFGGKRHG